MPLIQGRSKKAFSKNVESEMKSGKPQDQSLAIAYNIKNKNKKKMAEGGEISANNEKRPMPDDRHNDAKMASQNSGNKPPKDDQWTDNPTIKQAQKPSITKLSRPKMVGSDGFSVRDRDDVDKDLDRMNSEAPASDREQPRSRYNEEGPDRQGPQVSDMEAQHNNKKAPYIKASEDQYSEDEAEDDMKKIQSYAKGGPVMEPEDSGIQERERSDEANEQSMLSPSEDEGSSNADSRNEEGPDRQGPEVPDMEREHSNGRKPYAEGGMASSDDQPYEEADEERHNSIAAAIMAKKDRLQSHMDSGSADLDHMVAMYEGGQVEGSDESQADIMSNGAEQPNAYYPRNREILKENYDSDMEDVSQPDDSNEEGDSREDDRSDKNDMVSAIRSKMKSRKQFKD